jgi:hypothetical protein
MFGVMVCWMAFFLLGLWKDSPLEERERESERQKIQTESAELKESGI